MKWLFSVLGCLLFIGVVLTVGYWLPAPSGTDGRKLLSYDQFISISLTAITVVLAVIALLMAYLAFEGKNQIVDKAREVAKEEFERLKPYLVDEIKKDARDQVMEYVAQQSEIFNSDGDISSTGELFVPPGDVQELKNV